MTEGNAVKFAMNVVLWVYGGDLWRFKCMTDCENLQIITENVVILFLNFVLLLCHKEGGYVANYTSYGVISKGKRVKGKQTWKKKIKGKN